MRLALLAAVVVAHLADPLLPAIEPVQFEEVYELKRAPVDDSALSAWARSQSEVLQFQAQRKGNTIVLRYIQRGWPGWPPGVVWDGQNFGLRERTDIDFPFAGRI